MNATSLLVDTENKLKCALNDFERAKIMCIDTEYDSFHYFREKLCLIQIHAGKQRTSSILWAIWLCPV